MGPDRRSLASEVVATFFITSATDSVVDHVYCDAARVRAFAARHGYDDAVHLLRDTYCGTRQSAGVWQDGRRLREALRRGPEGNEDRDYPEYILVLLLCCIVQRELADAGEVSQNFRHALTRRLGFHIEPLDGLPILWHALREVMAARGLQLVLPTTGPKLVRYHRFLVFPVRSDITRIERLLTAIPTERRLDDTVVANKAVVSGAHTHAYRYHFEAWRELWQGGDPRHEETTFWRVLDRERRRLEQRARLVVRPSDDFPFELSLHLERDGVDVPASNLKLEELVGPVARAVARGRVELVGKGMDRYVDVANGARPDFVLLERSRLDTVPEDARGRRVSDGRWWLAPLTSSSPGGGDVFRPVGWTGGTKVGRALLHVGPFAPRYWAIEPSIPSLESDRGPVPLRRSDVGTWAVDDASVDGPLRLRAVQPNRGVTLRLEARSSAVSHHRDRIREFEPSELLHEDGTLERTAPPASAPPAPTRPSEICHQDPRFTALGETLYARSARGISYGEVIALARMIERKDTPSAWDLVRSFVDAGWYEPGWVKGAEARRLTPRRPRLVVVAEGLLLDGLVCGQDVHRLLECAERHGAATRMVRGSPWEPTTIVIEATDSLAETIADEARLPLDNRSERVPPRPSEAARRVTPPDGWSTRPHFGILRASRDDGHEAPYWLVQATWNLAHQSATAALLHMAELSGRPAFVWRAGRLERRNPGAVLPTSWARWLRARSCRSAAAEQHGDYWSYGYPADLGAVRALASVTSAIRAPDEVPSWIMSTRVSGAKVRSVVVGGRAIGIRA